MSDCPDCEHDISAHTFSGCEVCACPVPLPEIWEALGLCGLCGGDIVSKGCRGSSCSHEACTAGCADCGEVVW